MKPIVAQEWYIHLVDECHAIMVEAEFTSRWAVVEGYWLLGERISKEHNNFERGKIYGREIVKRMALSLQKSPRTIQKAVQFYKKYPNLDKLPAGKNTSWHQVCNMLLPEPSNRETEPCQHIPITICSKCGEKLPLDKS